MFIDVVTSGKKKLSHFGTPPAGLNQKKKEQLGKKDGPAGKRISFASKMASV